MLKVEIDQQSGCCFGVEKAIGKAEEELRKVTKDEENKQIYFSLPVRWKHRVDLSVYRYFRILGLFDRCCG
jgi:hypothetical protein